jgi:hypothetical protein
MTCGSTRHTVMRTSPMLGNKGSRVEDGRRKNIRRPLDLADPKQHLVIGNEVALQPDGSADSLAQLSAAD